MDSDAPSAADLSAEDMTSSSSAHEAGQGRTPGTVGGISAGQLKSIIERIERLEEEKAAIAGDIRDIYSEAKANGYDTKVLRQIVKIRKMDSHERTEQEAVLETYLAALGMA